ncbi:MAG: DUF6029 family protein [Prevotellaceae bacterium]|jgi:hypothetical protein|nr:DUF6029 family protein [Prevotellaceae bacterium]
MNFKKILFFCFLCLAAQVSAQIKLGEWGTLSGNLQSDNLLNAPKFNKLQDNSYLDLNLNSRYVFAGLRLEYLQFPLPGYEADFAGYGLGNIFVTGKYKNAELTLGNFYDQFGSGLIFRTYEERSLGIDNSLLGARLKYSPAKGVYLKALGGKQRRYFSYNEAFVWGADAEVSIEEWVKPFEQKSIYWTFGASFVSKHEAQEDLFIFNEENAAITKLNFPENVGAIDFRTRFQKGNISVLAEYAFKANDPSADNGYVYHNGTAALLSFSYSKKGISALAQAKRSDNMSFRSRRSEQGISSFINHLPAFTQQQTYALPAIYPYATQPDGEWAFQGDFSYTFPRKTALGGKYGTLIRLNASHIRAIDRQNIDGADYNGDGKSEYKSSFFKMGETLYYQDINFGIDKKVSSDLKLNFLYMFQKYNPRIIVQHDEDIITSHIFVAEGKYNINKKLSLRVEAQYLHTSNYTGSELIEPSERSNQGDWVFGLAELSVAPNLMFSVQDMYNVGTLKKHFYMANAVYTYKSHRVQAGFGKTRAGYDCSGGVCRFVPETYGIRVGYNYTF